MAKVGKQNVRKLVGDRAGVTEEVAKRVLGATLDVIIAELSKGNSVTLTGFGTWKTKVYKPRKGRNPQTGKALAIPARTRVLFKAGSKLRDLAESSIDPDVFFGLGGGADVVTDEAPDLLLKDVAESELKSSDQDVVDFFEEMQQSTKNTKKKKAKKGGKKKRSAKSSTKGGDDQAPQRVVEPAWFAQALAQRQEEWEAQDEPGNPKAGSKKPAGGTKGKSGKQLREAQSRNEKRRAPRKKPD